MDFEMGTQPSGIEWRISEIPVEYEAAVGAVDLGGERRDAVLGEAAHRRPQHVDLGTEIKIERREPRVAHGEF